MEASERKQLLQEFDFDCVRLMGEIEAFGKKYKPLGEINWNQEERILVEHLNERLGETIEALGN